MGGSPELRRVWEIEYKGEQVQVMVMSTPTFNCVINRFGCSVSQVWWKGNIQVTESFLMSHHLKVNIVKGDYNAKETYVKKMTERYPEYEVFEESAHDSIKSSFEASTKTSLWMLNNLGNKQTYKNSKQLFENEFDYKAFKEFLNY